MKAEKLNVLGFSLTGDVNMYSFLSEENGSDAERIKILRDVITEYIASKPSPKVPITSSKQASDILLPLMKGQQQEEFWAMFLDKGHSVIAMEKLTVGGFDATVIDCRLVLRKALQVNASALIVSHNHPSGNPIPSKKDIECTRRLHDACRTMDIKLMDHIIVCDNGKYFSFTDEKIS